MKKILLAFLLLPLCTLAQKDTSFWFAAPEIVEFLSGNPHDKPLLLRLTSFGSAATVSISLPADPSFTPINTSIAANSTITVDLSAWDNSIENSAANTIANKGILIRSSADITAYYEVKSTCNCNPELFALKGKSAIGNEFIIASQKEWQIDTVRFPTARSAFNIVATENNTVVTITPSQPLIGRPAGIPFNITLNRGQSFSNQGLYRNGPSLLNGSIVLADKPISVTASEDLLMSDGPCADLAGDQLIPTSIWGNEFVVIRGALTNKDKVIITAMTNGTAIYLNGNATPAATINRGQSFESNLTAATLYVKTSNRVSVYHYTGINCEIGSAVIPKINCTGSQDVAITRSIDEDAEVFIVTRQGLQGNFTVNGSNAVITAADFSIVPGSGGAYVFCKKNMNGLMSTGLSTRFVNNTGKFSLGFLNGATPSQYSGCRYGYFSDFKSSSVTSSQREICRLDSTQLTAFGGTSYQWSPAAGLSSTTIANPKASPSITTDYKVIITTAEGCIDSAFVKVIVNTCESDSIIVNNYTPVLSLDICKNIINVENAIEFNVGDTVLMIQMKGAVIDSTNTATFGSITNYKNAGNYEFNYVKSKSGNSIELRNVLLRQYDLPGGKVQLIRVPYYLNANFDKVLTCLPWDGNKGGVLAINVRDTLTLGANMDVSGRGFRGGVDPFSNPGPTVYNCYENAYFYPVNPDLASGKGEGIALISAAKSFGKGALANGGGGGNSHNSGGGGGSNGNLGGFGGYSFEGSPCNGTVPFNNRGIGGYPLPYNNAQNKIYLGGGGGAGHSNNPEAFEAKGGNGAGIIIITADKIKTNTNKVIANGNNGLECGTNTGGCHEGMGGGGAAGTVLLNINTYLDNTITEVKGGKGGDMTSAGNLKLGPGGGGSGGISWFKQAATPANLSIINTAGIAGVCTGYANDPWGATAGANGTSLGSLMVPVTSILFKPNIDSVRFASTATTCSAFNFNGLGFTNAHPIASWQWYFGDGGTATTQNTSHTYTTSGTFNVKLVVIDINGCRDSIIRPVNTNTLNVFAGNDASYCSNTAVTHSLNGSGAGTIYNWQPAALLNDNSLANPVATVTATTKFYLTQTDGLGCSAVDSVVITINPVPVIATIGDTAYCSNSNLTLSATGATSYTWSPSAAVSNPSIANPVFIGTTDQTMTVTGTNVEGCSANGSFDVTVKVAPVVLSIPDSILCGPQGIVLTTSGAQTYAWSPATALSNAGIASPTFTGTGGIFNYTVTGTASNGCTASDIVNVTVNPVPVVNSFGDTSVCSNSSLQLLATGAANYVWSPAAAVSNPNISNPIFTATGNQTITVTGSNAQGCSDTHSFDVSYNIAPVITTIPDSTVCNTQSIVLTTTGAQTYSWSPAINLSDPTIASPVFSGNTGNTYTVTGTAANGCSNTEVVTISTRAPGVFNTPLNKSVCINSSVLLDGNNGSTVSYQWSPAATLSNPNTINPVATPMVTGNNVYTLLISETVCNSSRSFNVNVLVNNLPVVTANRSNDLDCAIRTAGLTASGAVSYTWTPAATLNNASIATPVASPTANTTYTVVGTDINGCKDDGTVTVLVKGAEGRFDIPNSFTPNGDGKNDCFGVKHWGDASSFYFIIFNRLGEKVFETRSINTCWDGRYKGQPANIGNYVYYIKSVNFCGEQVKKGNVLLLH